MRMGVLVINIVCCHVSGVFVSWMVTITGSIAGVVWFQFAVVVTHLRLFIILRRQEARQQILLVSDLDRKNCLLLLCIM